MLGACDITTEDIQNDVQFQIVKTHVLRKMQQNKELTPLLLFHDGKVLWWVKRMKIQIYTQLVLYIRRGAPVSICNATSLQPQIR